MVFELSVLWIIFSRLVKNLFLVNVKSFWYKISNLGNQDFYNDSKQRSIILLNRINAILILLMLFGLLMTMVDSFILGGGKLGYGSLRLLLTLICSLFCLLLSAKNYIFQAKIITSVVPIFLIIIFPTIFGEVKTEYFFYYPFAAASATLIPMLLWMEEERRVIYYIIIGYCFMLTISVDQVLLFFADKSEPYVSDILDRYILYKTSQIILFLFVVLSVQYLIKLNKIIEGKLRSQNIELKEHKEELQSQNEELQSYQEELSLQNERLQEAFNRLRGTQDQLLETEKMASIGVLTAGIAHEINNPINFINSAIEGLKSIMENLLPLLKAFDELEPTTCREHLSRINELKRQIDYKKLMNNIALLMDRISQGIDRTVDIIKGLRTISHLDIEDLKSADIGSIINDALILLENHIPKRVKIIKNFRELPYIKCFPGRLEQVFVNIIGNAIDSISKKGTIEISVDSANENDVLVIIKDNGVGIAEDIKSKVFDPFFTTKDVGKGSGLGLAISYSIIKKHSGRIEFDTKPGEGTEFRIYLPLNPTN
ncbi:MAG: GHKL domain-containing protein [Bacteroidales bacterium]|nr:GHKL domain-containing protein [Bacteroidales bacterium]